VCGFNLYLRIVQHFSNCYALIFLDYAENAGNKFLLNVCTDKNLQGVISQVIGKFHQLHRCANLKFGVDFKSTQHH
jgi:hypothetical protein